MKIHPPTEHELYCERTAVEFVTVRGRGAQRQRVSHPDKAAAVTYAAQHPDGRTMVYAVNEFGNSAHIGNF